MRFWFYACYSVAAVALLGAMVHMIYGTDKVLGIFLVIVAVILARVLVLNVAERMHATSETADKDRRPDDSSPPNGVGSA